MVEETGDLEQQCEDEVFQMCCTRERYSVRCANQLEKYLNLKTKINTASVQHTAIPDFKTPISTDEQQELFKKCTKSNDNSYQLNSKSNIRSISNRLKELRSIVKQIERSQNTEIYKLLDK